MARVPFATRESMDAAGQAVWDEIETSRGGVQRNYAAILNNPQAASNFAHLGGYVRFETPLPARVKAVAVLTAAMTSADASARQPNSIPPSRMLGEEMLTSRAAIPSRVSSALAISPCSSAVGAAMLTTTSVSSFRR